MSHIPKLSLLSNTIPKHQTWTKRNWIGLSPIGTSLNITKDWKLEKIGDIHGVHSAFPFLRSANAGLLEFVLLFQRKFMYPSSLGNQEKIACRFCSCVCHSSISASATSNPWRSSYEGHAPTGNIRSFSPGRIMISGPSPYFRVPSKFQVFRVRSVKVSKRILWTLGLLKSPVIQQLHQFHISPASFECSHCFRSAQTAEMKKKQQRPNKISNKLHLHIHIQLLSQLVVTRS